MDTLPNDVLIAIFDSYMDECSHENSKEEKEVAWQSLVHVCRRWRSIVFGSPRHLDLQLVCKTRTRARDTLDAWPILPLVIECRGDYRIRNVDNILAVLERNDRVCRIILINVDSPDLEIILAAMQQPFPELTGLDLWLNDKTVAVVPDSFLGGSAPRLEDLTLGGIPFPGIPKLLLSATHLVNLHLRQIPHSGYFSPDVMVTALSTLTNLEIFSLRFQSPRSCPDQATRRPLPSTRSVLPVLTQFWFKGVSEYLEDLVARIDAPQLNRLPIRFFNDIVFDTPQFMQFISRTPMLKLLEKAHITLSDKAANVNFLSRTSDWNRDFNVEILCRGMDWQVSSLEQVCTSLLPSLSMSEDLYIYKRPGYGLDWKGKIENGLWVEVLHPFTTVKNLYLSEEFALRIVPALGELVEGRTTEVLPALQNIFLEGLESSDASGSIEEGIGQFIAAREVAGHPIIISRWANSENEKIPVYHDH